MSLLRLLSTGRSLIEFKESGGRYRVTRQRLLPQFGSARNPFRVDEAPEAPPQQHGTSPDGVPAPTSAPGNGALQNPAPARPSAQTGEAAGKGLACRNVCPPRPVGASALARRVGRWVEQVIRRVRWPRPRTARPAIPRFDRAGVQGELSLELVKVVRNDLSDADLEVVLAKQPAAGAKASQPEPSGAKAGGRATPWGRMSTRLFGAGKR